MKKTLPIRHYFNRAKVFGYLVAGIFLAILAYFVYALLR